MEHVSSQMSHVSQHMLLDMHLKVFSQSMLLVANKYPDM